MGIHLLHTRIEGGRTASCARLKNREPLVVPPAAKSATAKKRFCRHPMITDIVACRHLAGRTVLDLSRNSLSRNGAARLRQVPLNGSHQSESFFTVFETPPPTPPHTAYLLAAILLHIYSQRSYFPILPPAPVMRNPKAVT